MKKVFAVIVALMLLCLGSFAQADKVTYMGPQTVNVGNAGNAADPTTGYGAVGYAYSIGKYEVTAGQYTDFLNAVAATDTYGLYNPSMDSSGYGCQITRLGSSGSYTYDFSGRPSGTEADWANRPVNFVSFWDACRFANWLGTGSTETGAYTLTPAGIAANTITRNASWTWAVTSQDEWYKAAYYDTVGGYYLYPTMNNSAPGQDLADVSGNNANYRNGGPFPIGSPYYTTVGGEFQNSDSAYGTFDQGGNVYEWNEAIVNGTKRDVRGGSFNNASSDLLSSYSVNYTPTTEFSTFGFRVSGLFNEEQPSVPEPSSIIALVGGLVSLLGIRRRKA